MSKLATIYTYMHAVSATDRSIDRASERDANYSIMRGDLADATISIGNRTGKRQAAATPHAAAGGHAPATVQPRVSPPAGGIDWHWHKLGSIFLPLASSEPQVTGARHCLGGARRDPQGHRQRASIEH